MDTQIPTNRLDEAPYSRHFHRLPWILGIIALELVLMGAFLYFTASATQRQDTDQTNNQQATGEISLSKLTNGPGGAPQDGPMILAGNVVTWTYTVTNTGTIALTG